MNLTTIQLKQDTKKKLEQKKIHPRESYDAVISRILEDDEIPSLQEAFKLADSLPQKKKYSTEEIIQMTHAWRGKCRIS